MPGQTQTAAIPHSGVARNEVQGHERRHDGREHRYFRQWAAIGTTREGYYAHMFVWEAQNTFSYLSAEETTADFAKWMFEHGKTVSNSRRWRATRTRTT